MAEAITVEGLSKTFRVRARGKGFRAGLSSLIRPEYRTVQAVRGIDLAVEEGASVAFIGPNGAGKSTTIKMLTGILTPSEGRLSVMGMNPGDSRSKLAFSIGSVFGQKSQLWFHLPPLDGFRLLGAVYEIPPEVLESRIAELSERFGIGPYLSTPVRKLSLGERVRCEIVASLLHKPRILFLDEPTIGLDVVAKREIRLLLAELNAQDGVTIFLTSHDVGDIEKVCRRAVIVHHGTIVVDEPMASLKGRAGTRKMVTVKYLRPTHCVLGGLDPVARTEDSATYEVDTSRFKIEAILGALVSYGDVADLSVQEEPLEELIADIYETKTEEEAHAAAFNGQLR